MKKIIALLLLLVITGNTFAQASLLDSLSEAAENKIFERQAGNQKFGFKGHEVLLWNDTAKHWTPWMTLPWSTRNAYLKAVSENEFVYSDGGDSVQYLYLDRRQLVKEPSAIALKKFAASAIKEVQFSYITGGCGPSRIAPFLPNGDYFYKTTRDNYTASLYSHWEPAPEKVECGVIASFLEQLPEMLNETRAVADIHFTAADYERCRQHLDTMSYEERPENLRGYSPLPKKSFDKKHMLAALQEVPQLEGPATKNALKKTDQHYGFHFAHSIHFVNASGSRLTISQNFMDTCNQPIGIWHVYLDGIILSSASPLIDKFAREIAPAVFVSPDKAFILQQLAWAICQKKEEEERLTAKAYTESAPISQSSAPAQP